MRAIRVFAAQASVLALGLTLAGCGDGGGGISSTPTPGASYTKIVDLTGDHTFQTAGVQYNLGQGGFTSGSTQALGSGVTVAYTASSDSYKLTAPDNTTATFAPSNVVTSPPPGTQQWIKNNGTTTDVLTLIVPQVNGVALSYTIIGTWGSADNQTHQSVNRIAVGGMPTLNSDMPRTGTATYATAVGGAAMQNGALYTLNGHSSGTFSANFANNSVTTALTLAGTLAGAPAGGTVTSFGTFNGNGTISSTGSGFIGQLSGPAVNGGFSGAFFGPRALEMGYGYFLVGATFNAVGVATGVKQ